MRYLLNAVYLVLLGVYLPVLAWQRIWKGKRRPGLWTKFVGKGPENRSGKPTILFHAVSLGEMQAIRNLVGQFARQSPDWHIVISTTTQTGRDAAQRQFPEHPICLLPFDFSWANRRFLDRLKPDLLVLAELEIWPNLLAECALRSIPVCVVNARLNARSHARYRRLVTWFPNPLVQLSAVACQTEEYANRFQSLGLPPSRISVTGNLKYDDLLTDRQHPRIREFAELIGRNGAQRILIAGSTQAPEEQLVIDAYRQLSRRFPDLRLLICPRHPERFDEVAALLESSGMPYARRSRLNDGSLTGAAPPIVLLDSMGELGYWWGVGDIAFVGGSFGNRGGQNMMEPLALGNAVCFGPDTRNFAHEVRSLLEYEAAVELQRPEQLLDFVSRCLEDEPYRRQLICQSERYLAHRRHDDSPAWSLTLERIEANFPASRQRDRSKAA